MSLNQISNIYSKDTDSIYPWPPQSRGFKELFLGLLPREEEVKEKQGDLYGSVCSSESFVPTGYSLSCQ